MTRDVLDVTVVIPTLGRPVQLRACLESLAACRPRPAEILVVDQGGSDAVRELVESFATVGATLVPCRGRGVALGRNVGLRAAAHDVVLVTDDDCTVAADWVGTAAALIAENPAGIVTGRVLPLGDPEAVPSWKDDDRSHDFTGEVHGGALFPNNMVLPRTRVLEAGGFDEAFGPAEAAEDNEFCYRWLRAGGSLRYEPSLVVWHHDWRTPEQLRRLYVAYARGQGFFYAKHLYRGDVVMARWLVRDLYWALRGAASAVLRRRPGWADPRRGILRGLPGGFVHGLHVYRGSR